MPVVGDQEARALDGQPLRNLQLALTEDLGVLARQREPLHPVVGAVGDVDVTPDAEEAA